MKKLLILILFVSYTINSQNFNEKKRNHLQTAGHVLKTSVLSVPQDFVYFGKEFSNDWKKTGYYAAGIFGFILIDKVTTSYWQKVIEPAIDYKLPNISIPAFKNYRNPWIYGENAYLTYPTAALYIGSLFMNDERGQYTAVNVFKAIAYSTLITQLALKTIFGRNRPNRPLDAAVIPEPWTTNNFDFFNKRQTFLYASTEASAFPSLHTTAYFAIAKVFQMEYDNYWIPYGVMSVVWLSEIKGHNHWVSDIVFGGIVGTLIGRSIVKSSWKARGIEKENKKGISFNYIPSVSPEFTGLRIIGTF